MKIKLKVYHGTDKKGAKGIINEMCFESGIGTCATPAKEHAEGYAKNYLLSFKYEYEFKYYRLFSFLYTYLFNRRMLLVVVNDFKINSVKVEVL